jgi:hypothetical protein
LSCKLDDDDDEDLGLIAFDELDPDDGFELELDFPELDL